MNQNYGVLRVVRVKSGRAITSGAQTQGRYATGWLPEDGLVHVLSRQATTIGRALNNDVILMDPTVSREHARLILDGHGWHIINLTAHNVVRVNGHTVRVFPMNRAVGPIPAGCSSTSQRKVRHQPDA